MHVYVRIYVFVYDCMVYKSMYVKYILHVCLYVWAGLRMIDVFCMNQSINACIFIHLRTSHLFCPLQTWCSQGPAKVLMNKNHISLRYLHHGKLRTSIISGTSAQTPSATRLYRCRPCSHTVTAEAAVTFTPVMQFHRPRTQVLVLLLQTFFMATSLAILPFPSQLHRPWSGPACQATNLTADGRPTMG